MNRETIGPTSRRGWAWALGLAALVLLAACGEGQQRPAAATGAAPAARLSGPVRVGVVGPLSGDEAAYGNSVVAGIQAAAKRINAAGGLGGHPVEVLALDDQSNTDITHRQVQDLIGRQVAAIFAAPAGSSTFAPIHLVNDAKTLFLAVGSRRHLKASGPYIFRVALADDLATEALIGHLAGSLGWRNFALVTNANDEFSLDLSSHFRKALIKHQGSIKVQSDTYDTLTGSRNFAPVLAALKGSPERLDAVIFTGGATEAVALLQAMRQAGTSLPMVGGEELHGAEFLAGGEAVEGSFAYASFSAARATPAVQEFVQAVAPAQPDRFAALAYDGFTLLADAIRTTGSTDAAAIRTALLARHDFQGATGSTQFSAENLPLKQALVFRVEKAPDGQRRLVEQTLTRAAAGKP